VLLPRRQHWNSETKLVSDAEQVFRVDCFKLSLRCRARYVFEPVTFSAKKKDSYSTEDSPRLASAHCTLSILLDLVRAVNMIRKHLLLPYV
jgi:hypothetical protein